MARRSGLGKGLGALIPNEVQGDRASRLLEVPVSAIRPNPHQPRSVFDEEALAGLTASVRELGVLQPVLVRASGEEDVFELIAGERRWRAAKRAGLLTIPVIVREVDGVAAVEQALVENLHRSDLNPLEEAAAYQQLIEDFGLTHDQLSTRVGKSRAAITNTLRLFQLPPAVQRLVADGELTAGHARALLGTPDRAFQEALARRVTAEQLSVRAVEEAVRNRNELGNEMGGVPRENARGGGGAGGRLRPPGVLELESLLSDLLATRVKVDIGAKRGKVLIEFADLEDLERIYRAMTESSSVAQ
ncbi:ParB/RepB/Spo0J family partition protein [Acidiferrimicrobium sp. IK]|uniref:ParB/RepB/Spo0J family partition protein n=1 Tax=Acidiferrimicrobium sp. IK TaxID=2871700 RepID=UPI0021CAE977|nr:ParB/RepB/Spo0J family partition protein [Acidiferrimicrobium sp. IK]MCU4187140.1 ParB/RepB/Spo0J family partition protein [Acidiferrimicrobium sp. IK]